jgi:hypothetical protein
LVGACTVLGHPERAPFVEPPLMRALAVVG